MALAILSAVVVASQVIELVINRVLRPDLEEWSWISEVLVIAALLVITTMWARLRLARTAIVVLERERLTIHAELAIAAKVQRALLPVIPERDDHFVWYAAMEPAAEVGGDYYDFFPVGRDRMWVVLADVSGKGVPAAVFVSNTRAVLRAVARDAATPAVLLTTVSDILRQDSRTDLYVTCVVVMVDMEQHTIVTANAGHPPGIILRPGAKTRVLGAGGPPLGLFATPHYDEEHITLEPGDLIVVVSDGITDAIDASGDEIPGALAARLASPPDTTPLLACQTLLSATRTAPGPAGVTHWADDRTVVAFAFLPEPSDGPSSRSPARA